MQKYENLFRLSKYEQPNNCPAFEPTLYLFIYALIMQSAHYYIRSLLTRLPCVRSIAVINLRLCTGI